MPGVPGLATNVPKRSTERRRRNASPTPDAVVMPGPVTIPELPEKTHPIARGWYESLKDSGQSQFYEPSDWHAAIVVADMLTRLLSREQTSAVLFAAAWSAMGELLSTEGSRRRLRMEIERVKPEPSQAPGAIAIDEYRSRLTRGGRRGAG